MLIFIGFLVFLIITILFIVLFKFFDNYIFEDISFVALLLTICFFFGSIVVFTGNFDSICTPTSHREWVQETKNNYELQLKMYEANREKDFTASQIYLSLTENIINFNEKCRRAQTFKDTWCFKYLIYDPCYVNIEPIDFEEIINGYIF